MLVPWKMAGFMTDRSCGEVRSKCHKLMVLLLESVHDLRLELNRRGSCTESVRLTVTVLQIIRIMWQHSDVMATS